MNYGIIFKNKGQNEMVQDVLAQGGIKFDGGKDYFNAKIFAVCGNRLDASWHRDIYSWVAGCGRMNVPFKLITAEKFLSNPGFVECWKKPEPKPEKLHNINGKDFSESTIKAALKAYVG